ncbi:IS5/IS1182 family transposase, partial [Sutcliffiella cohnii]
MPIIRQESLFSIQDLYDLESTQRFEAIFSTIDMDSAIYAVSKKSWLGAPTELNYAAMIY